VAHPKGHQSVTKHPNKMTLAELSEKDLENPCPQCFASPGEWCPTLNKHVHFARRLKWLLAMRRPDLVEPPS
jgi:hypothetical protein